jgi:hypothetical protein
MGAFKADLPGKALNENAGVRSKFPAIEVTSGLFERLPLTSIE